jgi:hypothetical protein
MRPGFQFQFAKQTCTASAAAPTFRQVFTCGNGTVAVISFPMCRSFKRSIFAILLNGRLTAARERLLKRHIFGWRCSHSASGNLRSKTVNLRSLALLVFIFGASAALAGYIGMKYEEPASQHQAKRTAPPALAAAPSPSAAAPSSSPTASPSVSKPDASVVSPIPARETTQPPQEIGLPAKNATELSASTTTEAAKTTGSQVMEAPKCNKEACANAYRSFDAGDCTYQPTNGARRICKK